MGQGDRSPHFQCELGLGNVLFGTGGQGPFPSARTFFIEELFLCALGQGTSPRSPKLSWTGPVPAVPNFRVRGQFLQFIDNAMYIILKNIAGNWLVFEEYNPRIQEYNSRAQAQSSALGRKGARAQG